MALHLYIHKAELERLLSGQTLLVDLFVRGDVVCYKAVSVQLQYDALERLPAFVQAERALYGKPPAREFHPPSCAPAAAKKGARGGKKRRAH